MYGNDYIRVAHAVVHVKPPEKPVPGQPLPPAGGVWDRSHPASSGYYALVPIESGALSYEVINAHAKFQRNSKGVYVFIPEATFYELPHVSFDTALNTVHLAPANSDGTRDLIGPYQKPGYVMRSWEYTSGTLTDWFQNARTGDFWAIQKA